MTKPTMWVVCPAKTQISLGIHSVWSESSLSTWRKLGSLATHWAHSEDWSDWADAQADLSLRWAHMPFCWFCHDAAQMKDSYVWRKNKWLKNAAQKESYCICHFQLEGRGKM